MGRDKYCKYPHNSKLFARIAHANRKCQSCSQLTVLVAIPTQDTSPLTYWSVSSNQLASHIDCQWVISYVYPPIRGLRYYRIGIESPIFLEKSIVSVSYQYRNSWTGKYRISISIDFSRWKVSVSVSVSPFSKMSIKFSITPNYTLFWILKCNKNGYFHYFW